MAPLVLACIVLLIIIIVALLFYANDRKVEKLTANPAADISAACPTELTSFCNYCSSGTPGQKRTSYNFINAYAAIGNSRHTPVVKQFGNLVSILTYYRNSHTDSQLNLFTIQVLNMIENNVLLSNFIKSIAQVDQAYVLNFLETWTAKHGCYSTQMIKTTLNSALICTQLADLSSTLSNEFTKVAELCQGATTVLLKFKLCPQVMVRTQK